MEVIKWERTSRSGLYRRADGKKWKVTYYAGGRQLTKNFDLKRGAEDFLADHRQKKRTGAAVDPRLGRITLQGLYDAVHEARDYAPATVSLHVTLWKQRALDPLKSRPINALVESTEIDAVLRKITAPAMQEKTRLLLSALFAWAMDSKRRWVAANPARTDTGPATRTERKRRRGSSSSVSKPELTAGELARLIEATPEPYRALVHLMGRVGLRPGEACALRVGKVTITRSKGALGDVVGGSLLIDTAASGDTKSGEAREVLLPAVIAEELAQHIGSTSAPGELVFPTSSGSMLGVDGFRHVFNNAAKRAGVNHGISPHALRHTAVAWAVSLGANVYDIQKMVGHAKPSTTLNVYGYLWKDGQQRLAERMDAAIREEMAAGAVV